MYQMILRGARFGDGIVDVGIEGGRIARVARRIEDRAAREVEAHGRLVSPPGEEDCRPLMPTIWWQTSSWR